MLFRSERGGKGERERKREGGRKREVAKGGGRNGEREGRDGWRVAGREQRYSQLALIIQCYNTRLHCYIETKCWLLSLPRRTLMQILSN